MFSCYKEIYKYKQVNSPPEDPYTFIQPTKILFTPGGLYGSLLEVLMLQVTELTGLFIVLLRPLNLHVGS